MSAAIKEKPITAPQDAYEMPRPEVGQIVRWYPGGIKGEPHLGGVVVGTGLQAVNLRIFEAGSITYKDGVQHIEDPLVPQRRHMHTSQGFSGCWDFSLESMYIQHLVHQLRVYGNAHEKLTDRIRVLEAFVEQFTAKK